MHVSHIQTKNQFSSRDSFSVISSKTTRGYNSDFSTSFERKELDQRRDDPLLRTEMARYMAQVWRAAM